MVYYIYEIWQFEQQYQSTHIIILHILGIPFFFLSNLSDYGPAEFIDDDARLPCLPTGKRTRWDWPITVRVGMDTLS